MPELGINSGAGCSFYSDTYTAFAVERIDHLRLITYLPYTYLTNDLCGTGANKSTVKSKPCTHIR